MKLYRVKYDFKAEEEGELSVEKGDLVKGSGAEEDESKDGWTLVETVLKPLAKGYVPSNYIVKVSAAESTRSYGSSPLASPVGSHFGSGRPRTAGSASGSEISTNLRRRELSSNASQVSSVREKSPTRASRMAPIRRLSDPRLPQHLLETLEVSDVNSEGDQSMRFRESASQQYVQQHQQMPPPPAIQSPSFGNFSDTRVNQLAGPTSHVDLNKIFAAHDHWLEQVLGDREKEFNSFEESVGSVYKALQRVNEKNQDVISKIMSLEAQVESQRQQLKHKIDEDNATMNSRFAQLYA